MIQASVLGATGYAGIELTRLLMHHPEVTIKHIVSNSFKNQLLSDIYPNFKGISELICEEINIDAIIKDSDVIFTALPHGTSTEIIPILFASGKKIIDLSGDFRYKSAAVYEKWYGTSHTNPELLSKSVYGLPELHRSEIQTSYLVGNPGCYATSSILAIAPLIDKKWIDLKHIIIDAKSGVTGAGRNPSLGLLFSEVHENTKAYSVAKHRHTSEIEQELGLLAIESIMLSFTPHLLPVKRGILCTTYCDLLGSYTYADIQNVYKEFYDDEPFVSLHKEGFLPEIKHTNGSNYCHIGFVLDERLNRVIIVSTLDNLIKGAGGQAIQNMNIMFGLDETIGLKGPGWYL